MKDKKDEILRTDYKVKKRKRSFSGIELPSPEELVDDFEKFKIDKKIRRFSQKYAANIHCMQ